MFRFQIDEHKQTIVIEFLGMLSLDDAARCNATQDSLVQDLFRRFGRIKVLADSRQFGVQPAAVVEKLHGPSEMLLTPQDRLAIVVTGSLASMQANRLAKDSRAKVFTSIDEAEAWLDSGD